MKDPKRTVIKGDPSRNRFLVPFVCAVVVSLTASLGMSLFEVTLVACPRPEALLFHSRRLPEGPVSEPRLTPTPMATPRPTPTPTPQPIPSPTRTPSPTPIQTPLPTPSPTPRPNRTPTPPPHPTRTPTPRPTRTPVPDAQRQQEIRHGARPGELEVTLFWEDISDIDLAVRRPDGVRIWARLMHPDGGGELDVDYNGQNHIDGTDGLEHIRFDDGSVRNGEYVVDVTNAQNRTGRTTPYTITIRYRGILVSHKRSAIARVNEQYPIVRFRITSAHEIIVE